MRGRWSGPPWWILGWWKEADIITCGGQRSDRKSHRHVVWSCLPEEGMGRAKHSLGYACILCLDQCCGTVYFLVGSGSRLSLKNIITEIDVKSQRSASRCPIFFAFPFLAPAKKARLRADLHCRKS